MSKQGSALEEDVVRDVSPGYLVEAEAASTEDVPPGYKRTEVGVVPQDWRLIRLDDVAKVSSGGTPSRTVPKYWNGDIPWVTTSEVDFSVINQAEQYISFDGMKNSAASLLPSGTILMALYGQGKTRGKVGILGISATTNQACAAISLNSEVEKQFVFQLLVSKYEAIRKLSNTGNQENLNSAIVRSIPLILPSLSEQRAIATALSDADALIESLARLIAKKRAIKQAAMQQLLTGQTRLPGFTGEWKTKSIDKLEQLSAVKLSRGQVISQRDIAKMPGRFPIYSSSVKNDGLFGRYGQYMFDEEMITWSVDGGGNFFYRERHKFSVTNVCGFMRVNTARLNCRFLALQLQFLHSRKNFDYQTKAHPSVIRKEYQVKCPPLSEQTAIATVLSDMDTEIEALEHRRDKARQIKQGMMQQLLTGRVRLVKPEGQGTRESS